MYQKKGKREIRDNEYRPLFQEVNAAKQSKQMSQLLEEKAGDSRVKMNILFKMEK